jgi:hypothetical protein
MIRRFRDWLRSPVEVPTAAVLVVILVGLTDLARDGLWGWVYFAAGFVVVALALGLTHRLRSGGR